MKYFAFAIKAYVMLTGIVMMFRAWSYMGIGVDFASGLAIFLIGLYLALDGKFGKEFSGCIFPLTEMHPEKKVVRRKRVVASKKRA